MLSPNPVHSGASSGGLQFKVIFIYIMFSLDAATQVF